MLSKLTILYSLFAVQLRMFLHVLQNVPGYSVFYVTRLSNLVRHILSYLHHFCLTMFSKQVQISQCPFGNIFGSWAHRSKVESHIMVRFS